jgi:hypothetical protein
VVSARQDPDRVAQYLINQPVFLSDPTRPATGEVVPERFRLAESRERMSFNVFDQLDNPERGFAILTDPPGEIVKTRWIKDQAFHELPPR